MEHESLSPGGCRVVKRTTYTEDEILNTFNENLVIRKNGETINEKIITNTTNNISSSLSISNDNGVMDPATFFNTSAVADIAKKLM